MFWSCVYAVSAQLYMLSEGEEASGGGASTSHAPYRTKQLAEARGRGGAF